MLNRAPVSSNSSICPLSMRPLLALSSRMVAALTAAGRQVRLNSKMNEETIRCTACTSCARHRCRWQSLEYSHKAVCDHKCLVSGAYSVTWDCPSIRVGLGQNLCYISRPFNPDISVIFMHAAKPLFDYPKYWAECFGPAPFLPFWINI
jgi:hypothetical protein